MELQRAINTEKTFSLVNTEIQIETIIVYFSSPLRFMKIKTNQ